LCFLVIEDAEELKSVPHCGIRVHPWLKRLVFGTFWRQTSIIVIDAADFGFSDFVR
jgi:hypothetical protein